MTVKVETRYMEHKGGTKFYETVLLTVGTHGILIKRWGSIDGKKGGGQTQFHEGGAAYCESEKRKIEMAKTKAAHGYSDASLTWGLHTIKGAGRTASAVLDVANVHYANSASLKAKIADFLEKPWVPAEPAAATAPVPMPAVEIDRGDDWGTF